MSVNEVKLKREKELFKKGKFYNPFQHENEREIKNRKKNRIVNNKINFRLPILQLEPLIILHLKFSLKMDTDKKLIGGR